MADLLDYGAPEQTISASAASGTAPETAPVAGQSSAVRRGTSLFLSEDQLAPQQPDDDTTPVPDQPDADVVSTIGVDCIRFQTLHCFGAPITQLSTSRVFAWLVECGASPVSVEWVNDFSCNVVFKDNEACLVGLSKLLAPPSPEQLEQAHLDVLSKSEGVVASTEVPIVEDPVTGVPLPQLDALNAMVAQAELGQTDNSLTDEQVSQLGISLLTSRKLRPVPLKVYLPTERAAGEQLLRQQSQGDDEMVDADDVRPSETDRTELTAGQVQDLRKLTSSLYARWAVDHFDHKKSNARTQSGWYRKHGFAAGRNVVPLKDIGRRSRNPPPEPQPQELHDSIDQRATLRDRELFTRDRSASPGRSLEARRGHKAYAELLENDPGHARAHKGRGGSKMATAWSSDEDGDDEDDRSDSPYTSKSPVYTFRDADRLGPRADLLDRTEGAKQANERAQRY